jgi:hypothetical protein
MMTIPSTWETRELPVLSFLVEHFDDSEAYRRNAEQIAEAAELSVDEVQRALRSLYEASPPYIDGITVAGPSYPIFVTSVSERARRAVGQWPTPETLAERIVAALHEAAGVLTPRRRRRG